MLGKSFETQKKLAFKLHEEGVKIAFNPTEYLIKEKNIEALLRICEIFILNKDEAKLLTKEKDLLKGLYKFGPKIVVMTDKNNPAYAYDGKNKYSIKPHKIKVVERTGAGDAFASGFVAGRIAGKSINDSLKLALREGESVLRYLGAKNKLLRMKLR
jgi:sugar/nucleoside kinase (ribokinase family)